MIPIKKTLFDVWGNFFRPPEPFEQWATVFWEFQQRLAIIIIYIFILNLLQNFAHLRWESAEKYYVNVCKILWCFIPHIVNFKMKGTSWFIFLFAFFLFLWKFEKKKIKTTATTIAKYGNMIFFLWNASIYHKHEPHKVSI